MFFYEDLGQLSNREIQKPRTIFITLLKAFEGMQVYR